MKILITLLLSFASIGIAYSQTQRYVPRLDARDAGRISKHGDGPDKCDANGMREPSIVQEDGKFFLFYDGCAAPGWLACLATSADLKTWEKHGRVLSLGPKGTDDSATASSPWVIKDGDTWHMFYVASPFASPPPDYIPVGPYLTMHASAKSLYGPWTQHRDHVPFRPKPGTFYSGNAYPGHIIKHDGEFLMFFNGGHAIARTKDLNGPWKIDEQPQHSAPMENASIYFEESNGTYWMFVNQIRMLPLPHTDSTWVYWSKDPNKWNERDRAVVLDGTNSSWSKSIIGMATVTKVGNRLAIFYDGNENITLSHMNRDIGLAWLDLPLSPDQVRLQPLRPSEDDDISEVLGDWIWHPTVGEAAATVRFQKTFDLPKGTMPKRARLMITADDAFTVWLNGERIGNGTSWQQTGSFDVTQRLREGSNRVAVEVVNGGGNGGVIAGLKIWADDGGAPNFKTGADWLCGLDGGEKWFAEEAPEGWLPAKVLGSSSIAPWHITSSDTRELPPALLAAVPKSQVRLPNELLGGGFESETASWTVNGGGRVFYDWGRFPRQNWMGDTYLWMNGPAARATQTTTTTAQPGELCHLTAEVGYSIDIRNGNMPWPGGRIAIFTTGSDGSRDESSLELPPFTAPEAGTFKHVSLLWPVPENAKGRTVGVRLESDGAQTAWDNVRLEVSKR